ncbi:diphthamide biosynthesis enzyme Dph2 [Methanococcoides methylutens]|uniref:2-(3-amino-3-carboxypropyl)histidine synthase n=1 Tax=Methanococcoides methylutens MM1 TaxID=1434104 RepID=A0A0E3ST84_METMT|nr:diphthamide biosynthesis enzyme Dph2 [Methanococcoides methylutens]AKB85973.1 diptheria toxin resistance protein required for diphthamide biosynthesis (Saccharomyces)-like 1 [Methanococcoides methylutens MM1]
MSNSEPFDFRIEYIIDTIKDVHPTVVGLQFPEGFKRRGTAIADRITEATGVEVLISANPCYGACDLDVAILDNVDILFHFGHAQLDDNKYSEKVIFIETRSDTDVTEVVRKAIPEITGKRIGVMTTVQHIGKLPEACEILEAEGKECLIGRGDSKIAYPGQVLGCNFSVADGLDCDEYLYIGSGQFHPLGVSLATGKRVLIADPFSNEVREVDPRKIMKQRSAVIANSLDAETFGILVSTKPGQYRMELARQLKELAEKHGKKAYILTMDLITPDQMLQFRVDAFVSTACPRLAIDEVGRFSAPMLTPPEFEIVIGEREWEDLTFDEIRGE